jgi:CHAT domain-containing protein
VIVRFSKWIVLCCQGFLLVSASLANETPGSGKVLLEQARQAADKGQLTTAAEAWAKAVECFRREGDTHEEILASIGLAEVLQAMGRQRETVPLLENALRLAERNGLYPELVLTKGKLGAALIQTRQLERAGVLLDEAVQGANSLKLPKLAEAILNDQGNLFAVQQKYDDAIAAFEKSIDAARQADDRSGAALALANAAATVLQAGRNEQASGLNEQALAEAEPLEASHAVGLLLLRIGQSDRQINIADRPGTNRVLRAYRAFHRALEIAEQLHDLRIETYALGYLAQLYQEDAQPENALALTRRAIQAAQESEMPEALYRWEWQLGRLLQTQHQTEQSISAYRRAIQTLQPIRVDVSLGYANSLSAGSFRESEGPLYFELADLLLRQAKSAIGPDRVQRLLVEARDTVEQLKTVELEDYFQDECVNIQRTRARGIGTLDQHTAVIYLIPLPDRTELLVGLARGLQRFTLSVGEKELARVVQDFRHNLEKRTSYGYLEQGQQLYDWLMRPMKPSLQEEQIDTLVFVPDGSLRTIPFSSLFDGERYLIQDFAVAVSPGLSLLEPHPIKRENVHLLLNGLSEPVQGYPALNFVSRELQSIQPLYRNDTLFNESFTSAELKRKLTEDQYSVVHIASHGQFNRDVRKTFVLTYDGKLTLNDLEALIRPSQYRGRPVEMLILSACQTAAGDDRAALGLAGVAVKAGARSALATLWFVNDESTSALVSEIYHQLRDSPHISKAKALQAAQLKLLSDRRYQHACYWAPYLMIGNWL